MATTASAAVPPSARISAPTSAVAGWPAATPGLMESRLTAVDLAGRRAGALAQPEPDVADGPIDGEDLGEDGVAENGPEHPAVDCRRAVVAEQEVLLVRDRDLLERLGRDVVELDLVDVDAAAALLD